MNNQCFAQACYHNVLALVSGGHLEGDETVSMQMSHVMRKSVFSVSFDVQYEPHCITTEDG